MGRTLQNLHGTALVVCDRGVLIRGEAQSGKTTLALTIIEKAHMQGHFASLVADDQLFVEVCGDKVVAKTPESLAGLVEVRGRVPQFTAYLQGAVIDLVITLIPAAKAPRFCEGNTATIVGCKLQELTLSKQSTAATWPSIASVLKLSPF